MSLYWKLDWTKLIYKSHRFTELDLLLITLLYYRQNMTQRTMGWILKISPSTVNIIIDNISVLLEIFFKDTIKYPLEPDRIGKKLYRFIVVGAVCNNYESLNVIA